MSPALVPFDFLNAHDPWPTPSLQTRLAIENKGDRSSTSLTKTRKSHDIPRTVTDRETPTLIPALIPTQHGKPGLRPWARA